MTRKKKKKTTPMAGTEASTTFFGTRYNKVPYPGEPADYDPNDINLMFDDKQCKVCAVEPNYCKMQSECHSKDNPFVFVKSIYLK